MSINSKSDVCNMAVSQLGNYGTVSNIDTPTKDIERTCALWYDICRQFTLKLLMPNFALGRTIVAQLADTPPFGYAFYYEYPNEALKILGVGNVKDKLNNYAVEGNKILHDFDYTTGMPIRYIKDVQDINEWSPEAVLLLSKYIAAYTCLPITQDLSRSLKLKAELPADLSSSSSMNAQENMPIRISRSRFQAARYVSDPNFTDKK